MRELVFIKNNEIPASYQQLWPEYVKCTSNEQAPFSPTCYPQWQNNRSALESSGERILETLKKGTTLAANPGEGPPSAPDVAKRCFQQLANSYEEEYGGFRDAPKFPSPGRLSGNHGGFVAPRCSPDSPFLFSPCSQSDVPHVVLVREPLHLGGGRGPADGPAHPPHDGTGRHPRSCGTGTQQAIGRGYLPCNQLKKTDAIR